MSFGDDTLVVDLEDGRRISVPIAWFPRLAEAMATHPQELSNWRLIGSGIGIHWPGLDEHVSVENLLANRSELLVYRDRPAARGTGGPPDLPKSEFVDNIIVETSYGEVEPTIIVPPTAT